MASSWKMKATLKSRLEDILPPGMLTATEKGGTIELLEKGRKGIVMKVEITNFPCSALAVKLGNKIGHWPAFEGTPVNRICDYILVLELEDRVHAILVELKKTLRLRAIEEPGEQLRRSLPLLRYLQCVWEVDTGRLQNSLPMTIDYCLVYEREHGRGDIRHLKLGPNLNGSRMEYENIEIRLFQGVRIALVELAAGNLGT